MSRRFIVPGLIAVIAAAACGWAELTSYLWTDYELADERPLSALVRGDLHSFFHTAPIDGPSLLLRAPFGLVASVLGGGALAVYRMVSVPGLLAGVILGVVLWALHERVAPKGRWGLLIVLLAAANPMMLRALETGHAEEMLGAVLCVGAVLAALHQRPWLAGVLLGLALGNKVWAVLAIGPVFLALDRRRWSAVGLACAIGALFVVPFLLFGRNAMLAAGSTAGVFQPWQIWWPLGEHGHVIHGFFGVKPDYRAGPDWIAPVTHPLIAALVVPAAALWRMRRGPGAASKDVLLLLALLFLARCVLDPANNGYYHLPFLMALLAWEALSSRRPPVLSLIAAALVWLTVERLPTIISPDAQSAVYLAWALPAMGLLSYATYVARGQPAGRRSRVGTSTLRSRSVTLNGRFAGR